MLLKNLKPGDKVRLYTNDHIKTLCTEPCDMKGCFGGINGTHFVQPMQIANAKRTPVIIKEILEKDNQIIGKFEGRESWVFVVPEWIQCRIKK